MSKKILTIAVMILLLGVTLFTIGYIKEPQLEVGSLGLKLSEGSQKLEELKNLEIEVVDADIYLTTGSDYSITYRLNQKEDIENFKQVGDTLNFKTKIHGRLGFYHDDWQVVITIPADVKLENVRLKTISGDIISNISNINNLELHSVSGDIKLKETKTSDLKVKTTSGDIEFNNSHENVFLDSISGDIEFNGDIANALTIKTISSDIELDFNHAVDIETKGLADVEINGLIVKKAYDDPHASALITIDVVSGDIEITTK